MSRALAVPAAKHAAGRWPGPAALAADAVGAATYRLRPGMEPAAVTRLLPHLTPREVDRVRRASWRGHLRTRAWEGSIDAPGVARAHAPVELELDDALRRTPKVLALFHLGPVRAVRVLLDAVPDALLLARTDRPERTIEFVLVGQDPTARAAGLTRAVRALRDGRTVAGAVDTVATAAAVEATLFGRPIALARGPFALARMARVPIVPIATTWRGRRPAVLAGAPIASSSEPEAIAATARWLEEHLRRHPGDISPRTLRDFG